MRAGEKAQETGDFRWSDVIRKCMIRSHNISNAHGAAVKATTRRSTKQTTGPDDHRGGKGRFCRDLNLRL
jgi:hypothetical protein